MIFQWFIFFFILRVGDKKVTKKGNLDDLIDSLQTRKISSLQKSKLDWDKYKKEHNIEDELEYHKKDG